MRPLTARQVAEILSRNWFFLARQNESHQIYKHLRSGMIVIVPAHGNNPFKIGTLLKVIKQSGLPKSEFER